MPKYRRFIYCALDNQLLINGISGMFDPPGHMGKTFTVPQIDKRYVIFVAVVVVVAVVVDHAASHPFIFTCRV